MNHKIKNVRKKKIAVARLHCLTCPHAHNPDLWNGDESAHILNAPHVEFLRLYIENKDNIWSIFRGTRYYRMYEYWDEVGYGLGGRTHEYITRKAKSLLALFESIRKKGYDKNSRIQVLKRPLWVSRGFSGGGLRAPEIFHGHHRAACCLVLKKKLIDCWICKDMSSGSKLWPQKLPRTK